jgi:hypothetical protein
MAQLFWAQLGCESTVLCPSIPKSELGQFDSGDRIATVVYSRLARHWPRDEFAVGESKVYICQRAGRFSSLAGIRLILRCRSLLRPILTRMG